jgi:hypothetical protein
MKRTLPFTLLLVLSLVASVAPAGAHLARPSDPNDTPGLFDIRRAYFTHRDGTIRVSVRMDGAWDAQALAEEVPNNNRNDNSFEFQFDSRGNEWADYVVVADWVNGGLQADLRRFVPFGVPTSETEHVDYVGIEKEGWVLRIKVPRSRLRPDGPRMAWSVDSYHRGTGPCDPDRWCIDRVPDRYLFVHDFR